MENVFMLDALQWNSGDSIMVIQIYIKTMPPRSQGVIRARESQTLRILVNMYVNKDYSVISVFGSFLEYLWFVVLW